MRLVRTYYYAGGSRIELRGDDEHVAVLRSAVPSSMLEAVTSAQDATRTAEVVVAPKAAFGQHGLTMLREAGALRPVFRHGRAMLVPFPEVRVEMDDAQQRSAVKSLLSTTQTQMLISEETPDRMVLVPSSLDALDAIEAANAIYEQAHPAASSARFVQITPRPDATHTTFPKG